MTDRAMLKSKKASLPPSVGEGERVILFDAVCKLCSAWSNFIIKHDKQNRFKLCSVQSGAGQAILSHFDLPTKRLETMLLVKENQALIKSEAFFAIVAELGWPWRLLGVFRIVPLTVRDCLYDRIALNRYKLFGKYDYCRIPSPDHNERYLGDQQ